MKPLITHIYSLLNAYISLLSDYILGEQFSINK